MSYIFKNENFDRFNDFNFIKIKKTEVFVFVKKMDQKNHSWFVSKGKIIVSSLLVVSSYL